MSLKNEIFKQLKEREGEYVSGQALAETFGVSRAAVWKAIDTLRKEGYALSGTPKAGYVLSPSDVLREEELSAALEEAGINGIKLYVFEALPSTNAYAEKLVGRGRFLARGGRGGQADAGPRAPWRKLPLRFGRAVYVGDCVSLSAPCKTARADGENLHGGETGAARGSKGKRDFRRRKKGVRDFDGMRMRPRRNKKLYRGDRRVSVAPPRRSKKEISHAEQALRGDL